MIIQVVLMKVDMVQGESMKPFFLLGMLACVQLGRIYAEMECNIKRIA